MVSNHTDDGQVRWLAENGVDLIRGSGRLAGTGAVEVAGERYTADNVVLANGADAFIPPVPGLRGLEGLWTNREATAMEAVPRRLLVLGGGPVGVELAQAVRRFGGEVVIVEGADQLLAREPGPLGRALGEVLAKEGIELALGVHASAARREGEEFVLELDDGRVLRGDRLLVATGRRPRVEGIGLETVGVEANPHGVAVDAHLRIADRLWGVGDITGIWQLTHVGKYQGEIVAANILGEPREASYEAVPRAVYTDPVAASVGALEAPLLGHRQADRHRQVRDLQPQLRRHQRLPHAAERRRAPDRRLRARSRGGGVAAAGDAGHPGAGSARRPARRDPAVSDVLGDLRRGAEDAPPRGAGVTALDGTAAPVTAW